MFNLQQQSNVTGKVGDNVVLTLKAAGNQGSILFGETTYAGIQVVAKNQTATELSFTLRAGRQKLSYTMYFLGPDEGEMLEKDPAGATQHVIDVYGSEPSAEIFIFGA